MVCSGVTSSLRLAREVNVWSSKHWSVNLRDRSKSVLRNAHNIYWVGSTPTDPICLYFIRKSYARLPLIKCKHCQLESGVNKKTYKYREGKCAKCRNKNLYQKVGTIINDGVKILSYGKTLKEQKRNLFSVKCINCGHQWRERSNMVDKAFCSPCRRNPESEDF